MRNHIPIVSLNTKIRIDIIACICIDEQKTSDICFLLPSPKAVVRNLCVAPDIVELRKPNIATTPPTILYTP